MVVALRCPGEPYGTPGQQRVEHSNGCCARFALMSDERRARTGLQLPTPEPRAQATPAPVAQTITVAQLARVVADLQRRATEFPDEEPPGATVWAEYGPEHTEADVLALYDMGRPYSLVLGYRRSPCHPEEENP